MPSLDYQLEKMENIVRTLRRSNRILEGLKKRSGSFQLNKLMVNCTTAIKATNGVIEHIEALRAQLLEDMNMIAVPVKTEEPKKPKFPPYIRRVK